jgi:hypothetical protein
LQEKNIFVYSRFGWNNTVWLDFDVKRFESQEECDRAVEHLLESYPQLQETFTERTHSGGWRIGVKVRQMPNFTNFTLAPDGNHVGEALGAGRFTVLAPTVGVSGNCYRNIRRVPLIEVECLEAIGIYPVNKKQRETSIPQTAVEDWGLIPLQGLASQGCQDVLEGVNSGDRSEALTKVKK